MVLGRRIIIPWLAVLATATVITGTANASATYVFNVSEHTGSNLHLPITAELVLSDAAVAAGQASNADIESLQITAGLLVRDDNPMTLSLMHTSFVNWSITLSGDRQKVTAIAAEISPHMAPAGYWLLYQPNPPHPDLQVHENLGYIRADSIWIETTLLPVPPDYESSGFTGEWQQGSLCKPCRIFEEWVECFPFCFWPWMIIFIIIVLPLIAWRMRTRSQ